MHVGPGASGRPMPAHASGTRRSARAGRGSIPSGYGRRHSNEVSSGVQTAGDADQDDEGDLRAGRWSVDVVVSRCSPRRCGRRAACTSAGPGGPARPSRSVAWLACWTWPHWTRPTLERSAGLFTSRASALTPTTPSCGRRPLALDLRGSPWRSSGGAMRPRDATLTGRVGGRGPAGRGEDDRSTPTLPP